MLGPADSAHQFLASWPKSLMPSHFSAPSGPGNLPRFEEIPKPRLYHPSVIRTEFDECRTAVHEGTPPGRPSSSHQEASTV